MAGGPGILTVGLHRAAQAPGSEGDAPTVALSVTDTGHGMDQTTIERIFEPFFTTRAVGQGTGLGLSVVHGIVESFGATMRVESAPGAGTTFRIFFAIAETPKTQATEV
jgi:signal transduction histidine kinase